MPGNSDLELDQLWFTWSTSGLGTIQKGFRVRAASEGLYDIQGMRYRRVNRFLYYELPEGASLSEFNSRIAPISLSFVDNGDERLLIRKVFIGQDVAGYNANFFTHLIAGLPREMAERSAIPLLNGTPDTLPRGFTARDAIRLWYCPDLWAESEQDLAPNETHLETIPYHRILDYVQHSQTSFNLDPVREKLHNLLLLILSQGLPQRITVRGHSSLIASLIYGLTHALPVQLLPHLTFTTYESNIQESEVCIAGTINGAEMQDLTRLQVQPEQSAGPVSENIERYVTTAVSSLVNGNTHKLYKLIDELERRDRVSVDDLIELFKRRFRFGELTLKQLEDIILHPADNLKDLLDPRFQTEVAQLLLRDPDYWERRGREVFRKIQEELIPGGQTTLNEPTRDALYRCLNAIADHVYSTIKTELMQGNVSRHSIDVLVGITHPSRTSDLYLRMLTELAQEPFYRLIISDSLRPFHLWLLGCTKLMQPLPARELVVPWLSVASWERLERVLRLDLPAEWEHIAMFELLKSRREIPPKFAIKVFKTHEAKCTAFMQQMLRQGSQDKNQEFIKVALRLFGAIIWQDEQAARNNEPDYAYPQRVNLLATLLDAALNDPAVIEALFACVPFKTPYQLTIQEFSKVVSGCSSEVLAARSASPSLMTYIQEFILSLTPAQLMYPNTLMLLKQFQQSNARSATSDKIAQSVHFWLVIYQFLTSQVFDDELLQNVKQALAYLVPQLQRRGQDIWHTFIEEMTPHLVALIHTEPDLQIILNVFAGARIVSAWDLLNVLAQHAGETLAESLYRLSPYLLCGIREYARAGLARRLLDEYLQRLFNKVSYNALKNVDMALSSGLFPEPVQREWRIWREQGRVSLGDIIFKKSMPGAQQQKQPTGSQPSLKLPSYRPAAQSSTTSLPPPDTSSLPVPPGDVSRQTVILPGQNDASPQETTGTSMVTLRIVARVREREYPIIINNYERVRAIWIQILQYWYLVLSDKRQRASSRGIASEVKTIEALQKQLQELPTLSVSDLLIGYFVDNLLIQLEIEHIAQSQEVPFPFLDPSRYVAGRLDEFKASIGIMNYEHFSRNISEQAIKDVLQMLIRRYHFIQYMEEGHRRDWSKWLAKARKSTMCEYQQVPTPTKQE